MKLLGRILIKVLLLLIIVVVFLFNYKIITVNNGFNVISPDSDNLSLTESVNAIVGLQRVYYYKNPINTSKEQDEEYVVFFETSNNKIYTTTASLTSINVFKTLLSISHRNVEVRNVFIVHWAIYLAVCIIILILPLGRIFRHKK